MTNSHDPTPTEHQPSTTPNATDTSDATDTTSDPTTTTSDATGTSDVTTASDGTTAASDVVEGSEGSDEEVGEDFAPELAGNPPHPDVTDGEDEEHLPPGQTSVPVGDEVVVDDATMRRAIEAILMVTDEPLPVLTMARAVGRPTGDVGTALEELAAEYTEQGRGFDLREVGGGWRYYTRVEAAPYVERFVLDGQQARLTQAALETLAVVAYKQPVSRARVSAIRGVNVDGVMRTLVARGLVEEAGSDTESQATLYRTSTYFLERMGMQSLDDLPELAPYLPDMDDIEDELAAQTLPPAPDAQPSADAEAGEAESSSDATPPAPDITSADADETSAGEFAEDAEAGEVEESDDVTAPALDGTSAEADETSAGEYAEDVQAGEVGESGDVTAPALDGTSAEEADEVEVDVEDVEVGSVEGGDGLADGSRAAEVDEFGVEAGVRDGG